MRCRHVLAGVATWGLFLALSGIAVTPDALADLSRELQDELAETDLIYTATLRPSGKRSSVAPVWFGVMDGAIWLNVKTSSYKAKRVKEGSPIFFATSEDAPLVEASAEIVADAALADRLGEIYAGKYWIAWFGMFRPSGERIRSGENVLIRVTPP